MNREVSPPRNGRSSLQLFHDTEDLQGNYNTSSTETDRDSQKARRVLNSRRGDSGLGQALTKGVVLLHPFIIGELACGNLKNRKRILGGLAALPRAVLATHEAVLHCTENRKRWGLGIGWVDAHLIASARLTNCRLWTLDRQLDRAGRDAGVQMYHRRRA